ncbi:thiamine ABC transporter substrate-binding protein [Vibrio ostreicida]|uniref:Thiamine ABC transporter substrate-binding protein n=1 Tax=Vibrio ostreicida TaxID=526588 RepID=A0ABT8BVJ7_9VIBR|nr:thiamine ABC transporter substrate-binding protein [Vibrio ostreicida]MDN3611160.1 thiamine ABC transporter substrate-binding protein [Vibrio ostreicida]
MTVTKGWSEAYSLFLEGESDMVLSYTTSRLITRLSKRMVNMPQQTFLRPLHTSEVAAKVKTSKNSKLADEFLRFMLSDDFQSLMPTGNWMYPVH